MPLSLLAHLPTCLFPPSTPLVGSHLPFPTPLLAPLYAYLNFHTHYHTCPEPLLCVTCKCASRTGHVGGSSDRKAGVHACIWSFHACVGAGVCTDVHIAMYV